MTSDSKTLLRDFKTLFLAEMVSSADQRKLLRPLLDVVERLR